MFPFILKIIWLIIQASLTLTLLLLLVGLTRLVSGWSAKYPNPLQDPAVLRKGDVILTGKQSMLDSWYIQFANVLTRKVKHRFWTHAALYAGEGKVWEAQPAGIIERDLNDYIKNGYYVRAFRHRYISDIETFDKVIQFCASKKGGSYDLQGAIFYGLSILIPVGFNFIFDNPAIDKLFHVEHTYFCSELVVDAFSEAGYPISPFDGWRVKPTDFISNPVLSEVAIL